MSGYPERLERRYRRLLACYPKAFRRDSADEIIGVLLATAREGQQRVGLAESADLIRGAIRMRQRPRRGRAPWWAPSGSWSPARRPRWPGIVWLIALAATVLIFTSQSAPYYQREPARQ